VKIGAGIVAALLTPAYCLALFLGAPCAFGESLSISGCGLRLLHGSPEAMVRFPYSHNSPVMYPSPVPGDIVELGQPGGRYAVQYNWPKMVFVWEDCGPQAAFEYRDHVGYLNGHILALVLSCPRIWEWLGKCSKEDLRWVKYLEIAGPPPADFALLLANLPRGKIAIRISADAFPSLAEALGPLEPSGVIVTLPTYMREIDLSPFNSCRYAFVEADSRTTVMLPPNVKCADIHAGGFAINSVSGGNASLESLRMEGSFLRYSWLADYRSLKAVAYESGFLKGGDLAELIKLAAGLPALEFLRAISGDDDLESLTPLGLLKYLYLTTHAKDISAITSLKKLKGLSLVSFSECDLSPLTRIESLEYLDFTFTSYDTRAAFDLDSLRPVADRIHRLGFLCSNVSVILSPEVASGMTALEEICLDGSGRTGLSPECLSNCTNLRTISSLPVSDAQTDIPPLAKLGHLECLHLTTDSDIDLSGLAACPALRELWITAKKGLSVASIASLTNLESLGILTYSDVGVENEGFPDTDCSPLAGLTKLQFLYLGIRGLRSAGFLGSLNSLRSLTLFSFVGEEIPSLSGMEHLRSLSLYYSGKLTSEGIRGLPAGLGILQINFCDAMMNLNFLEGAVGLELLDLAYCAGISALPMLSARLPKLAYVRISSCASLKDTKGLRSFPDIESLFLLNYTGTELGGFECLSVLHSVEVMQFTELRYIPAAAPNSRIEKAVFHGEASLWDIEELITWKGLKELDLTLGIRALTLEPLSSLSQLRHLVIRGGEMIDDISPLSKLSALRLLQFQCEFLTPEMLDALRKALPECAIAGNPPR